jgi:hypothetical protein
MDYLLINRHRLALEAILHVVPLDMHATLALKKTTKEA